MESEEIRDHGPSSSISNNEPVSWQQIEAAETYLVSSMYDEAASLASSILKRLSEPAGQDDLESFDFSESAGMVLVQSFKQLGRTPDILNVFKELFASIPVQVLLTGVCFCISEGHYHGIREFLVVYLSCWNLVGGKYYVLVGKEDSASNSQIYNEHFVLGVDKYLEVVEVYTVHLLGTVLIDVDLATSWIGNAKLPEDRRKVLLRRLHSLHSIKSTNSSQHNYEDLSSKGHPKEKYTPNGDTANSRAGLSLSKRLEPCFWWFRTFTLKFGDTRIVLSNGKIAFGFLILLVTYVLKRKQATLKRVIQKQAMLVKNALVDLWQLAFSYQVNPLAAVQPLAAAARMQRKCHATPGTIPACAACKHQRKKCSEGCTLAPYFPVERNREFQAVHKVFGVSNVTKMVKNTNEANRRKVVDSLVWEALCRQKDPVLGSYGEYRMIFDELKTYKNHENVPLQVQKGMCYKSLSDLVSWNYDNNGISNGMNGIATTNGLDYDLQVNEKVRIDSLPQYGYPLTCEQDITAEKIKQVKIAADSIVMPVAHQQGHSINNINQQYYISGQLNQIFGKPLDRAIWEGRS